MTERDLEILNFINEFGFCEIRQIEMKFGVKAPRSYKIIKRLVNAGLLIHERIFHNKHGVYYLTAEGARYTSLPALTNIPKENYKHQLAIINIYLKLIQSNPEATWTSERILKRDKSADRQRQFTHIPDGKLIFPDNQEIAIEVELTLKSKRRLGDIFRFYSGQIDLSEIWYFCPESINRSLAKMIENKSYIKLHNIEEVV